MAVPFRKTAGKSGSAKHDSHHISRHPTGRSVTARDAPPMPLTRSVSLRWRVTLLAASVVAIAVAVMAIAAYAVVSRALYADVDHQLRTRASALIDSNIVTFDPRYIAGATLYTTDISVALIFSDLDTYTAAGVRRADRRPRTVRGAWRARYVAADRRTVSECWRNAPRTAAPGDRAAAGADRRGARPTGLGAVHRRRVRRRSSPPLAGTTVGRTGLRPIARLTAATERVARTDDLTPMPVTGNDELARLTESFNTMLRALAESRERQSRLVADAGHELRHAAHVVAYQHGVADRVESPWGAADSGRGHGGTARRRGGADRGALALWSATSSISPARMHRKPCTRESISATSWSGASSGHAAGATRSSSTPSTTAVVRLRRSSRACRVRCSTCSTTLRNGVRRASRYASRCAGRRRTPRI